MRNKINLMAALAILGLTLAACSAKGTSPLATRTISVNGTGTVYLTPDIAYINVGVHTENPDVGQAVDQNNQKSQAVIQAIKGLDVADKDIQTTNFNVSENMQNDPVTGAQTGVNYLVDNTVNVTMRDLSKLSDLLDAVIQAGANYINGVNFDLADRSLAVQQARLLAVQNARKLAEDLAKGANLSLGDVQTLSYYDYAPSPFYGKGGAEAASAASSAPINPGQMQLTVNVSITYAIK